MRPRHGPRRLSATGLLNYLPMRKPRLLGRGFRVFAEGAGPMNADHRVPGPQGRPLKSSGQTTAEVLG